ncbi:MAG: hypothetical protein LBM18_03475 [Oscillospiraceae bacterium]|jgi:hypothetical protein|nr:hypothetical protein [Oscillospiraceae bacterium]
MKKPQIVSSVVLLALCATLLLAGCEEDSVSPDLQDETPINDYTEGQTTNSQRSYRVKTRGGGEDLVTLMVYMCGSDLESAGGCGTLDIDEIIGADISEKLNIICMTGGANAWDNDYVNPNTNEVWRLTSDGPEYLGDLGLSDMGEGETLTGFINYSVENFPADRYMMVMWDHGGGTVNGLIYDERFDTGQMMSISEMNSALASAGVVFDMIGFDCCLMATAATAFMVEKYADFMVASQLVEPGTGWYYTGWINALSENTSIPTAELGEIIASDYLDYSDGWFFSDEVTLSVVDLSYIPALFENMYEFFSQAEETLFTDQSFISTAQTLGSSRAANNEDDLVDLTFLLSSMSGAEAVLDSLDQAIVYNAANVDDFNGLCLYFPYADLNRVSQALDIYRQIGIGEQYQEFITTFANVVLGGQAYSSGGDNNPMGGDIWDLDYWLSLEWVDESFWDEELYSATNYDNSQLVIVEEDGEYVLELPPEEWALVTVISQRVFFDDGGGYIDLGADSIAYFNDDGDLIITSDNTWVSLDGQLVCFYTLEDVYNSDDDWYNYGYVPCEIDGQSAQLMVGWSNIYPEGRVLGWRSADYYGASSQKGLFELVNGMNIDFICDYYTYDGEYEDQYYWGNMEINGDIAVSYEDIGSADTLVYYELTDVYCNTYWTEAVLFSE